MNLIYVASPYTHPHRDIMYARAGRITQITAELQDKYGNANTFISPIVHGHQLVNTSAGLNLPGTWEYWEMHDFNLLKRCDELWVVCMSGWDKSRGVESEIQFARKNRIITRYVTDTGEIL